MITIYDNHYRKNPHPLSVTKFPDGTSQVWHLPEEILGATEVVIDWRFEKEEELFHLFSLVTLLKSKFKRFIKLHVPYLPYARQDKDVTNESTFNLHVFAGLINTLGFDAVTTVDPHSLVSNAINPLSLSVAAKTLHEKVIQKWEADALVFPDAGASERYRDTRELNPDLPVVTFEKVRNQQTGEITGHQVVDKDDFPTNCTRFLIIDDICDGGATFISVAYKLKEINPECHIALFVTHGIFSKGHQGLDFAGIEKVFTTNSLPRNANGLEV